MATYTTSTAMNLVGTNHHFSPIISLLTCLLASALNPHPSSIYNKAPREIQIMAFYCSKSSNGFSKRPGLYTGPTRSATSFLLSLWSNHLQLLSSLLTNSSQNGLPAVSWTYQACPTVVCRLIPDIHLVCSFIFLGSLFKCHPLRLSSPLYLKM